jgi:hypothetical protein
MTGTGCFLAIFGKIARVTGMMLFRHVNYSLKRDGTCPSQLKRPSGGLVVFTIAVRGAKLPQAARGGRCRRTTSTPTSSRFAQVENCPGKGTRCPTKPTNRAQYSPRAPIGFNATTATNGAP